MTTNPNDRFDIPIFFFFLAQRHRPPGIGSVNPCSPFGLENTGAGAASKAPLSGFGVGNLWDPGPETSSGNLLGPRFLIAVDGNQKSGKLTA